MGEPLRQVGAVLEASAAHEGRTGRDHLRVLCRAAGLPPGRGDEVLAVVGLATVANRQVREYSLGMRQRLGVAAALLGDPPVLMFDEPFNGMDPEGIVWLRGFLRSLAAQGRTVLVASHLMRELQNAADHVIVVGRGRVIADSPVAGLVGRWGSLEAAYLSLTSDAVDYRGQA
jgi:ABC-2 type transport system ATP-binding protein